MATASHHYPPALLDVGGVAHVLSYGRRHTQRLLAEPTAPRPVRIGLGRRWRYDEIIEWAHAFGRGPDSPSEPSDG